MNYLVNRLVNLGYLQRAPDPTDPRARVVQFTDRGRALEHAAETAIARIEDDRARLAAPEMDQLRRWLKRLHTAVSQRPV